MSGVHLQVKNGRFDRFLLLRGPSEAGKSHLTRQMFGNALRLPGLACGRYDFKGTTGGDRELSVTKLERATALFTTAMDNGSALAAWGAAEAWQQLALRYRELGRTGAADRAFSQASSLTGGRIRVASNAP